MKFVNLIFATDKNNLFGINNQLPWHNKEDLINFNRVTVDLYKKNIIVMGKNTFLSCKYLKNRINVVISSSLSIDQNENLFLYKTFDDFIDNFNFKLNEGKIFIIGGKILLEYVINKFSYLIDKIYHTEFPEFHDNESLENKIYINNQIMENIKNNLTLISSNDIFFKYSMRMNIEEDKYLSLLRELISNGNYRQTRNSKTYSIFNRTLTFDLKNNTIPILTTKKVFIKGIIEELLFFFKGYTNSKILEEKNVNIWKKNTSNEFLKSINLNYDEGDMGPMYGFILKHFGAEYIDCNTDYTNKGINQYEYIIDLLLNDPFSRRIIMTTYNPQQVKQGVLYPCHSIVIQFYVEQSENMDYYVSMNTYQRSVDICCGLPFNIASNGLFLFLLCKLLNNKNKHNNYIPNKLNIIMGDIHMYDDHLLLAKLQLKNNPYKFPQIELINSDNILNLDDFKIENIKINNYKSHDKINYNMVA